MSVDAYLGPNGPKNAQPDNSVLLGQPLPRGVDYVESVQEMIRELTEPQPPGFTRKCSDKNAPQVYDSVEFYDPVLLSHCRLK